MVKYRKKPLEVDAFVIKDREITIVKEDGSGTVGKTGDYMVYTDTGRVIIMTKDTFEEIYELIDSPAP